MFNSEEYSWADIEIVALGRPIVGARRIQYKESQEKVNIYGRGNKPVARSRGNKEYEGELGLLQSELEALQNAVSAGKSVLDIKPFDIVVSYVPEVGGSIRTDILKACEFTENEKGMDQGDTNMEIDLPLIIGDIQYNV